MPVFFIERNAIHGETVTIAGALARHLTGSLRIRAGEKIWLGEAGGPRYHVEVTTAARDRLAGRILTETAPPARNGPFITLGLAVIKGDGMTWAIQKATELGVSRLEPFITSRTVARPGPGRQTARWQNIAHEAAQQSMRWDVPTVCEPENFEAWLAASDQQACRLILWERPAGMLLRSRLREKPRSESIALAIGPEGGFDKTEIEQAERQGFEVVSLGNRILRSESAAMGVLAIVQYEWGDLG